MRRRRTVAGVAEPALVFRRDERRDHLALGAGQRVRPSEKNFGELEQRRGRFGTELQRAPDPRNAFG